MATGSSTPHDVLKDRILQTAQAKFFQFGLSNVTMDELAGELGISKKTLYACFSSKSDLVRQTVTRLQDDIEHGLHMIVEDDSVDFVERLRRVWMFLAMHLSKVNPLFLRDLRRGYAGLWGEIERRRHDIVQSSMGRLFKEGIRQRVFRQDLNEHLLLFMYMTLVENVINPEFLWQLSLSASEALDAVRKVFLEGILSDAARKKYGLEE